MSEIEKMYEKVGVEQNEGLEWVCQNPNHCVYQNLSVTPENCSRCEYLEREMRYPPFTAEKQIELIKWITENKEECRITYDKEYKWCTQTVWQRSSFYYDNFSASLAGLINTLWKNLIPEEKQQIKEILK